MKGTNPTSPAGAVTAMPGGGIRQHGDPNPELNSSPTGELSDLQAGDLSAQARKVRESIVTEPATDVKTDRADIGTE